MRRKHELIVVLVAFSAVGISNAADSERELSGDRLTEFGEKQNDRRIELRVRYFF